MDGKFPELSDGGWKARAREVLGQALGFRECPGPVLDELVDQGHIHHLARGAYLNRRGDPVRYVSMVVHGVLEGSTVHRDGQRHLLGLLLPGAMNALMSVVDDLAASHDLIARENCAVLRISIETLRNLREREISVVLACERQCVFRGRLLSLRLAADPALAVEVRAAAMLKMIAALYGRPRGQGVELMVRLSQSDLADWLGLSRQRMNFALKQLEAEGIISIQYSGVEILDLPGLTHRADS